MKSKTNSKQWWDGIFVDPFPSENPLDKNPLERILEHLEDKFGKK